MTLCGVFRASRSFPLTIHISLVYGTILRSWRLARTTAALTLWPTPSIALRKLEVVTGLSREAGLLRTRSPGRTVTTVVRPKSRPRFLDSLEIPPQNYRRTLKQSVTLVISR